MTQPEQPQQQPEQQPPAGAGGGTPTPPQQSKGGDQQDKDLDTPKFSQKHYNDFEARIRREYATKLERDKELIEKGKEYETLLQESQPLSERVTTQATVIAERESRIAALETAQLRAKLAWEAGLPPALGERVQGGTEDEIKADIEKLRAFAQATQSQSGGLRPNPQQGAPSSDSNRQGSVSAGRDLWAQRHKKADAAT